MSTVEKLLVQIFERKNLIIEQVKQQTELYNQHLASKLLIDGITPPTWLWSPSTSSDSKELNKEELISKLLRPYPQPSVRCSVAHYPVYNNLVITGDNAELCDGSFMKNLALNNGFNRQDDPAVPASSTEDHAGCAINSVPEPDASVASPEGQAVERILNIYNAPDQSLAGIQRSKSRQKALELRNSAKALAKSGLNHEHISNGFPSQIRFSLSATSQAAQEDELPKLTKYCVVGSQSCEDCDLDEAGRLSKEKGKDASCGRITRSRSCARVPDVVRDPMTLGCSCSSDDCRDNASSHVAKAKRKESMPISDSEQPDNHANKLPQSTLPSTVCCQSSGDREVGVAECLSKDTEIDAYPGRISRSKISSKCLSCASDSSKADSPYYQRIDIAMTDMGHDLHPDYVGGSLVRVNPSNVHNEGCEARESMSEDCKSPILQNACVDEVSDLNIPSHPAKADGVILAPSSERSAQQVNDSNEVLAIVKPSVGLFHRMTRSQTWSYAKEINEPVHYDENLKQKSAGNDELQSTSSGQLHAASYEAHDMLDEHVNAGFVMSRELALHEYIEQSGSSSSSDAKQGREFGSQVAPTPIDSFVFVEPKQLNFNKIEECNLKAFTSNSGKRRLVNSPEKISCSLSNPVVSLDKGISGGVNQLSLGKPSLEMSDVSSKGEQARSDIFESDVQENPDSHAEIFLPVTSEYTVLKTSGDNIEALLNCKISEVHHEADIMLSKMVDIPDVQIHPFKLQVECGLESLPERHMEEGNWSIERKDKDQLMSNAPESENSGPSHCHNPAKEPNAESHDCMIGKVEMTKQTCIILDKIKQFPAQESQMLSCLEGEACNQHADSPTGDNGLVTCSTVKPSHGKISPLERTFKHANMESWPQPKRRKIEHQQTHSFTTSASFRVRTPHSIQRDPASSYLKNTERNVETVLMDTFGLTNSNQMEFHQQMDSNLTEGIESTFSSQNGELMQVGFCYKENNEHRNSLSVIKSSQLSATLASSLANKEARNSQGCFVERMRTSNHINAREPGDGQSSQHLCTLEKNTDNLDSENLTHTNTILEGIQSPKLEDSSQKQHSVLSSSNEDLELIDVEQSMPVFEGFIVDAQAEGGELDFVADGIDLNKLNLPTTTIERASILAEICRSASLDTPLSEFSSAFEFQGTQSLFQSVSNGHLEQLDLGVTLPSNFDVYKQLQSGSSLADDYKDAFEGMPYSDCLAYSGEQCGWNSRSLHASPVGKLWERLSSHTGSSEKRSSSNPELTCFPIEEDPSISEENKTADENSDDVQEEIDSSSANHCDKRQPLKNLTNLGLNPPISVSAEEETLRADSVDCVSTKLSVTGTLDKVQWSPKNQFREKSETREKHTAAFGATNGRKTETLSFGTNGIGKAKESIKNSISKTILSNKTSLKRQDQNLSLKEPRRNNIVSNVSSFIPLIQQKQAATVCAGKRDVKVKALEAAEAAKRLEEKRENERKMRKEALKLERAKLEEKNLRHMELEKKKKEEERKKKDADIIAKKRLRVEEEIKEKEKKRMRLEARQHQREQEEKMRAEKAEKEKLRSKDEQVNRKKESHNEPQKQQNREKVRGDDAILKKTETKWTPTEVISCEECGTSGQSCEAGKVMHTVDKSPKNEHLIPCNSQGKSYEISPYQCSDDEGEEDDELPTKKYIPSWASKSSVALLLPFQQEMNPDVIFPQESFCSMDEVLLPRKLQQKQVAA